MNDGLRFRNSFNLRIQNIILCIFECQKTCGLRLRKPPGHITLLRSLPLARIAYSAAAATSLPPTVANRVTP